MRVLRFPVEGEIEIQADEIARIAVTVPDAVMPYALLIPKGYREGVEVDNISVRNRGAEVPFICKPFHGELFDGNENRRVPYGKLPLVPADPGGDIVLVIHNTTLEPTRFMAEMTVMEQGKDYKPKEA
jgi:hypothetical protein